MDATHKAYQEFMLGGKLPTTPPSLPRESLSGSKKRKKQVGPVFKAFLGRVEEWKDIDGQLEKVMGSIAHVRDRIWWESEQIKDLGQGKPWEGCGFRGNNSAMDKGDLEMALTHDLLQHEKLLAASRSLISSLAQAQDAMGRRLDEWMMMLLDGAPGQVVLDQAQEAYVFLAEELHRRQVLVQQILDSCHDGLLEEDVAENPRSVARRCCKDWGGRGERWSSVDRLNGSVANLLD